MDPLVWLRTPDFIRINKLSEFIPFSLVLVNKKANRSARKELEKLAEELKSYMDSNQRASFEVRFLSGDIIRWQREEVSDGPPEMVKKKLNNSRLQLICEELWEELSDLDNLSDKYECDELVFKKWLNITVKGTLANPPRFLATVKLIQDKHLYKLVTFFCSRSSGAQVKFSPLYELIRSGTLDRYEALRILVKEKPELINEFFKHEMGRLGFLKLNEMNIRVLTNEMVDVLEQLGVTSLELKGCKLRYLPDKISNLAQLRILDLEDNRISSLPKSLDDMPDLALLNVRNNDLREVACRLPKLNQLLIKGNPHLQKIAPTLAAKLLLHATQINNEFNEGSVDFKFSDLTPKEARALNERAKKYATEFAEEEKECIFKVETK